MFALCRAVGAFIAMMCIAYLGIVAFVPAPTSAGLRDGATDVASSASVRISAEAQALMNRKGAGNLQ